ncbi:hypothetical protein Efla_002545 [Eimeria flavescens]
MIRRGGRSIVQHCRQRPHRLNAAPFHLRSGLPAVDWCFGRRRGLLRLYNENQLLFALQRFVAHDFDCSNRSFGSMRTGHSGFLSRGRWSPVAAATETSAAARTAASSQGAASSVALLASCSTLNAGAGRSADPPAAAGAKGQGEALAHPGAPPEYMASSRFASSPMGPPLNGVSLNASDGLSSWGQGQPTEQQPEPVGFVASLSQSLRQREPFDEADQPHNATHCLSDVSLASSIISCGGRSRKATDLREAADIPPMSTEEAPSAATTSVVASAAQRHCRRISQASQQEAADDAPHVASVEAAAGSRDVKAGGAAVATKRYTAAAAAPVSRASANFRKSLDRQEKQSVAHAASSTQAAPSFAKEVTQAVAMDQVPRVSACSTCSLSSATVWKKWLQALSEEDPHRRQRLLEQYPPPCRRHRKSPAAGCGQSVVGFRQLLRLLDAAALHPHATADAVAALRQRVRLGITSAAESTASAIAPLDAPQLASWRQPAISCGSISAAASARLTYVERGLFLLAQEKGAQLMQSLRDFDCADSFLLEATADCATPRADFAPPRWSFKVLEEPLHAQAHRQGTKLRKLEKASLLILRPVDKKSAALASELRQLHGRSFDFSLVSAHGHAAPPVVAQSAGRALEERRDNSGAQQSTQHQMEGLQRVRCSMCGKVLVLSVEELRHPKLKCPDCAGAAAALSRAAAQSLPHAKSTFEINAEKEPSLISVYPRQLSSNCPSSSDPENGLGNLHHVLQQLEAADAWAGCRFALPAPTFIAVVCSHGNKRLLKVRVFSIPIAAAIPHGAPSEGQEGPLATRDAQQVYLHQQQKEHSAGCVEVTLGSRFWAMPVSFVEAVHARQIEALEKLADITSLWDLPSAPAIATDALVPQRFLCENHILEVLTASTGTQPSLPEKSGQGSNKCANAGKDTGTLKGDRSGNFVGSAKRAPETPAAEAQLTSAQSHFTARQLEAVFAATSGANRIISIEGKLREWLSKCMYTAAEPCLNPHCRCKSPIYVAAGTHAALRSLKNKLDQEGIQTVRLSDSSIVSTALQKASLMKKGHRLAALQLQPRRVLVDESSQLTEFAGLMALVHGADVAVLIGDEKQLPPACALPPAEAPRSLFSTLKDAACRSILLNLQFRMPPLVAAFISTHFYEGRLLTHPSKAQLPLLSDKLTQSSAVPDSLHGGVDGQPEKSYGDCTASCNIGTSTSSGCERSAQHRRKSSASEPEHTPLQTEATSRSGSIQHHFPWPAGSEGDRDLADRLLQQLHMDCERWGDTVASSCRKSTSAWPIPRVLPLLFVDTSAWASGPCRSLAKFASFSGNLGAASTARGCDETTPNKRDQQLVGDNLPVLQTLQAEQRVKGSLQNPLEAFLVYRCVNALLRDGVLRGDIAILTPYQAQAQLLSRVLHPTVRCADNLSSSKVGEPTNLKPQVLDVLDERCRPHPQVFTVDGFQGHERHYIILSAVKCSRRSPHEFFLFDPRRINVALSRASKGLIIVGSARALAEASPTWSSFLLFLRALGATLPLDHPSLRNSLTSDLLLPRPSASHMWAPAAFHQQSDPETDSMSLHAQ